MKYIKTENGWYVVETGAFFKYGEIAIWQYNQIRLWMKNYLDEQMEIIDNYGFKSSEMKEFKKRNKTLIEGWDDLELFVAVIDSYIPFLRSFESLEKFEPSELFRGTIEEQEANHQKIIEMVKSNGWETISNDIQPSLVDIFLIRQLEKAPHLQVSLHFYEGKWCEAYNVEPGLEQNEIENGKSAWEWLVYLDMIEVRYSDSVFAFCRECDSLYIRVRKNNHLCEKCTANYKKNFDKRRGTTNKGLIDKVCNYMRNSLKFTYDEINAFRDIANINLTTMNETAFSEWCKQEHDGFKAEAKKRMPIR